MRNVELLAPVGKLENVYAAIENGADAIFVGGKLFNARHFADNFDETELEKIVKYCKLRDVKVYITLNTLVKNNELKQVFEYIGYLEHLGVDALIVQDFGVARLIKKYFKNLTLHASTQMTAHSLEDVLFLKECGFKRVVLARELSLKDIKDIKAKSGVEIEVFIHGALCYSYSGQCLFSSLIGGRSGNRGRCAQPCRMTYSLMEKNKELMKDVLLLSPKDIYTLPFLRELIESGIDSFKVEGRMKSPEYVASVIRTYRKYMDLAQTADEVFEIEPQDLEDLQSIFNRGGFSKGYFYQQAGQNMLTEKTPKNIGVLIGKVTHYNPQTKIATIYTKKQLHPGDGLEIWNTKKHTGTGITKIYEANSSFKIKLNEWADKDSPVYLSKNHELLKQLRKTYEKETRKLPINMIINGQIGKPIGIKLSYKDIEIRVEGDFLESAENKPIDKDTACKQLSKMGSTPFKVDQVLIDWEEGYITLSKLNELRRMATTSLEEALLNVSPLQKQKVYVPLVTPLVEEKQIHYIAHVHTKEQLQSALKQEEITDIYWEWHYNDVESRAAYQATLEANKVFYLALPAIMKNEIWDKYKEPLKEWRNREKVGFLVRTYGQYGYQKNAKGSIVLDYTFNVLNNENVAYWIEKGASRITLSMELSKQELEQFKGPIEKIIYGKIPVMTTQQCILGNTKRCFKQKREMSTPYTLKDRKDVEWKLFTDCEACNMQILSSEPMWVNPFIDLKNTSINDYRFGFTDETLEETKKVLQDFFEGKNLTTQVAQGMFLKSIE